MRDYLTEAAKALDDYFYDPEQDESWEELGYTHHDQMRGAIKYLVTYLNEHPDVRNNIGLRNG